VAPVREHSRKPEKMRRDIEALWEGPYAELFARESADGWDTWGNQAGKFPSSRLRERPLISSLAYQKPSESELDAGD
jgi:N6-adenosine-specific RNA methylase IME4